MRTDTGSTVRRQDYLPFPFSIPKVSLEFELQAELTSVRAEMTVVRRADAPLPADLVLDGQALTLVSVHLNGALLNPAQYTLTGETLTIHGMPDHATLLIASTCSPATNTSMAGLYVSGKSLFTQCEAQGFRKICWFADRPDVMSTYEVMLRAKQDDYPLLLSNGNLISTKQLEDGRHEAKWQDPFAKPSYLFALVAGDFDCREQRTQTASGREVLLQVYSDPGTKEQTGWAMESLERSLRWDEVRFGLELDLDRFMIVAARDFNMGAMENKGLNVFNAAYVLADPNTATDSNYQAIEAVIGHEYFHNWTGNRVTCRDWFQLSLKEGLTVFRDQEFTADMMAHGLDATAAASARAIKRIDDVVGLRGAQFSEDSGPMAHPIRPESYQEIGNFYTATVYEKGAEVIRMMHTLLGEQAFRAGMDEYFRRHDGQAVTCDDFVEAMQWAYAGNLDIFRRWYQQAGTPRVQVALDYNQPLQQCTLTLSQTCPPVGVEKQTGLTKLPFHIPVKVGLLNQQGEPLAFTLQGQTTQQALLELTQASQSWVLHDVTSLPVPSLLRDFSAPVIIDYTYQDQDLALLSAHDTNAFVRWEAGQELASRQILKMAQHWRQTGTTGTVEAIVLSAWAATLADPALDSGFRARALSLPAEKTLTERMTPMDPLAVSVARRALRAALGFACRNTLEAIYEAQTTPGDYSPAPLPAGRRALKNLALSYLVASAPTLVADAEPLAAGAGTLDPNQQSHTHARALQQFDHATNMTDRLAAFATLAHEAPGDEALAVINRFYEAWQHDALVVDKWFGVQAASPKANVATVRALMAHPAFTVRNPNRARAVIFMFCLGNTSGLHAEDGSGYRFWAEQVLALDAINPEIAARLARAFDHWARFIPSVQAQMRVQLQRVATHKGLSRNTLEIVSKALAL
ncbi:MAG: aminopeptidase N [Alcaligenaceae bacterium]|nr:aminopeptidase N [Alcaligenaceae bacterium]